MSTVLFEPISEQLAYIWLNQPESLNAMSEQMAIDFRCLVNKLAEKKTSYRALIISGKGKAFSAGGDLEMLEKKTALDQQENQRRMEEFYASFLSILDLNIPLIAAINGAAVGAGLCLASACDIRVCSENAKLGFTFVKLGLHPGMGGTYFLPRVVGDAMARELMLTGRIIDASEAQRIGLVSQVHAPDQLQENAVKVAQEVATNGPLAVTQVIATLRKDRDALESSLRHEAVCQSENYASADFKEGIRAVREKRIPQY
jgi:enoyl-CoA hydratase